MDWLFGVVLGEALDLSIELAEAGSVERFELTLPRCLLARFRGRKAKEP